MVQEHLPQSTISVQLGGDTGEPSHTRSETVFISASRLLIHLIIFNTHLLIFK